MKAIIPAEARRNIFVLLLLGLASAGSMQAQTLANIPALSFTKPASGADPLPQTLEVVSTGSDLNFTGTWSTNSGGNWLSVSGLGCGNSCGTTPKALSVIVTAPLSAGTYTGQVVLTAGNTVTIPVTLIVAPTTIPFFDNLPGAVSFSYKVGGANPPSQTIQIRNKGSLLLNWTLSTSTADGGNWLSASATSGTAPSTVSISITPFNLPGGGAAGNFIGQLLFQSGGNSVTVPVTVKIGDSVLTQVSGLDFSQFVGAAAPAPQVFNITSTGSLLSYTSTVTTGNGGAWLSVSNPGCCFMTPNAVTATITTGSLPVGTYTGQIVVTTVGASAASSSITVPVTLSVTSRQAARALFRDSFGAINMTTYPSATLSNSGGLFGSDAGVAEAPNGDVFAAARDTFAGSVYANLYTASTQTWAGWQFSGGVFQGTPGIAVVNGVGWLTARDTFNSYWINSFTPGTGFGNWTPLFGIFSTDPAITSCPDGTLYIIGKDNFNSMYSGHYIPGTGFQGFQFGGGIFQGKPSITCGTDNAVYLTARDMFNSNWVGRVSGNTWNTPAFFFGGALTSVDPKIAPLGNGSQLVVIQDPTGVVYQNAFAQGTVSGWQSWTFVGGVFADISPAVVDGTSYFAGKTSSGDLYWWQQNAGFTFLGDRGIAVGALSSAPK